MLQKTFTKNYLNIYLYQSLSTILGFASLFIVVPHISDNKAIYGIYAICISVTAFFSYADLGFLAAGTKYATECYVREDKEGEYEYLGFSHYILWVCMLLFTVVFLILGYKPGLLIDELDTPEKVNTAKRLFYILAFFTPTIVLQRLPQMILAIRVKQYLYQRTQIVGNVLKIASVFYFFRKGHYDIVGYFLFLQAVTLLCALITCVQIKHLYDYRFKKLFRYFRFSRKVLKNTYVLALSSVVVTICWVLYYELDQMVIGKLLGPEQVAVYAIGFTLLTFIRTLLGVMFSPFSARFNHFKGKEAYGELASFYMNILRMTVPVVIIPLTVLAIACEPFILSWVGPDYMESVRPARWLILCNLLAFAAYPAGMVLYSLEKIRDLYLTSILMPVIFWLGVLATQQRIGVDAYALFKLVTFMITGMVYLYISLRLFSVRTGTFLSGIVKTNILPVVLAVVLTLSAGRFFGYDKSVPSLLTNLALITGIIAVSLSVAVLGNPQLRSYAKTLLQTVKSR